MMQHAGPVILIVTGNPQEVIPLLREVLSGQLQHDIASIADRAGILATNCEVLAARLDQLAQPNPPADAGIRSTS